LTENRLLGADFVRASACLIVLAHHFGQRMHGLTDFGIIDGLTIFSHIGAFGVAIFFVLSGYLLARPFWEALDAGRPIPSLRTYALRRAARILPAYWVALVISFVIAVALFGTKLDGQLIMRFFAGFFGVANWHWVTLFPVEVNGPLWSISFEITCYVLMPIGFLAIFAFGSRLPQWASRLAWIGLIGLTLLVHLAFVTYYPIDDVNRSWNYGLMGGAKTWMPRYNPFSFFAMFAIGGLAAGIQLWLARYRNWLFDVLVVAAIALTVWLFRLQMNHPIDTGYGWLDIPYGFPWFVLAIGAILATTPSSVLVGRILDNPFSVFIARISFGIYIWHYLIMELVRQFWDRDFYYNGHWDPVRFNATMLVVTVLTLVAATVSFNLIERPAIQWARGLEKRRTPEPISATAPAE
jgi:peptidoglycan/LPS O-acetylase OafA/YrhL